MATSKAVERTTSAIVQMLWGGRRRQGTFGALKQTDGAPHVASFDASRSLTALEQDSTIIVGRGIHLYSPDGVYSEGYGGDAHPACRNNAGARTAFRLRSVVFAWAILNAHALPPWGEGRGA